jgi:MerR family transcriptional regulator/heat shock protein HspR
MRDRVAQPSGTSRRKSAPSVRADVLATHDETTPLFVISVAAELTGLHAQTLRQYDRVGLVSPGRTPAGGRRYSLRNVAELREVARLSAMGIGLEGVRRILELENQVSALQARVAELQSEVDDHRAASRRTSLVVWRPPPRSR